MKKQSINYIIALAAAMLVGTAATAILSSVNANADKNQTVAINTTSTSPLTIETKKYDSKNETVYTISDHTGATKSVFIGSNLYTGDDTLPFSLNIEYFLDGETISTKELSGKSGHIKVIYSFESTRSFQNKQVPFIATTSITLDGSKFSNVKIDNGKIISEGESYMMLGYCFPGLGQDLSADFLPNSFSFEADTNGFTLGTTYTLLLNDLIAELDTSKLSTIDGLVNSVNQLANGLDQIVAGSDKLAIGASELANGAKALQSGANELTTGMDALASGSERLSAGLNQLDAFDSEVLTKIDETTATVTGIIERIINEYNLDPDSETLKNINERIKSYYDAAYSVVTTYTGSVKALADGATELNAGAIKLANGTHQLKNGIDQLAGGADQLASGSETLRAGLNTFKTTGIDRIVAFANNDLANFTRNARATVTAASSYRRFGDSSTATSVKFIIKTPSI